MSCESIRSLLEDYVDGVLAEADFQDVERHLAECEACQREEAELHALLENAKSLDREMPPPRDLWPDIVPRLAPVRHDVVSRRTVCPRRSIQLSLAAAAIILIGVAAVVLHRSDRSSSFPASSGTLVTADLVLKDDALAVAARSYAEAATELMEVWEIRREAFSPETQAVIDENLRIIDESLRKLREAIRKNPSRFELKRLFMAAHQKKVNTLQMLLRVDRSSSSMEWSERKQSILHEEEKS